MLKCKNIHVWALFLPLFVNRSSDIFGWPSWLFSNNIVLFGLIFAFFVNHFFLISFDWPSRLFSINIVLFGLIFCHLGSFVSFHYGLFSVVAKMNNL